MRYSDVVIEASDLTPPPAPGKERDLLRFTVRVLSSPAGEIGPEDAAGFDLHWKKLRLRIASLSSRAMDQADIIALGRDLADMLLPATASEGKKSVRTLYRDSLTKAGQDGGLRLRLRLPPRLAWLPWEYLYLDPPSGLGPMLGFLALDPKVVLLRHEVLSEPSTELPLPDGSLRIAAAFAQGTGNSYLKELDAERAALSALFHARGVEFEMMPQAGIAEILGAVPQAEIFHFAGHGEFLLADVDEEQDFVRQQASNRLLLAGSQAVGPEQLAINLGNNQLRLAVIGACLGAKRGAPDVVNLSESIARMLVIRGVPAVVANQFKIGDKSALEFSKAFYKALFAGMPVEQAMVYGRIAIYNNDKDDPKSRDWGVPVLYMRAPHGQLLAGADDPQTRREAGAFVSNVAKAFGERGLSIDDSSQRAVNLPPSLPQHYLPRPGPEHALRTALLGADDGRPTTILWGGEGVGKFTVAASVANMLYDQGFFAGDVIWADCDGRSIADLLRVLLDKLGQDATAQSRERDMAQKLWAEIDRRSARGGPRSLVIVDNVNDSAAIKALSPFSRTRNRLLVISDVGVLDSDLKDYHTIFVDTLEPDESAQVFTDKLSDVGRAELGERHRAELAAIAELYAHLPEQIAVAADQIASGTISPPGLLRQLLRQDASASSPATILAQKQEPLLQGLEQSQRLMFELISLNGTGPINEEILARTALCTIVAARTALKALAGRGLIKPPPIPNGDTGYTTRGLGLRLAQWLFARRGAYERAAATRLFVQACLDVASDLLQKITAESARDSNVSMQQRLQPLQPQIRRALVLAAADEQLWDLLRGFTAVARAMAIPYLAGFTGSAILDLRLATIERLGLIGLDTRAEVLQAIHRDSRIPEWERKDSYRRVQLLPWPPGEESGRLQIAPPVEAEIAPGRIRPLEASLSLSASALGTVVISNADLIDLCWTGVRTEMLQISQCRMIGAQLAVCTLDFAVLLECAIDRARLAGTSLRYSVLRDVSLRNADLQGVDLSMAVLKDVDLRGADLTGANLSGAVLDGVHLAGANLDNVTWEGCRPRGAGAAGVPASVEPPPPVGVCDLRALTIDLQESRSADPEERLSSESAALLAEPSAVWMEGAVLPDLRLSRVSWSYLSAQGADLRNAIFLKSTIAQALLQGARLPGARLIGMRLDGAAMTLADLRGALLVGGSMAGARLDAAALVAAKLFKVDLSGADLRYASLAGAHLEGCDLSGARLNNACLQGATLRGVRLHKADLRGARLDGALLLDVDLSDAQIDEGPLERLPSLSGVIRLDGTREEGEAGAATSPEPFWEAIAAALAAYMSDPDIPGDALALPARGLAAALCNQEATPDAIREAYHYLTQLEGLIPGASVLAELIAHAYRPALSIADLSGGTGPPA